VKRILAFGMALLVLALTPQLATAQSANAEMREKFEEIVDDLNENIFSSFQDAINERELVNRIFGTRVIEDDARAAFADTFASNLEQIFVSNFPKPRNQSEAGGEIIGTIIGFQFQEGQGRALVRYEGKGYRFNYHSYELVKSRSGRLVIVDWFDYYNASWFSEDAGNALVRSMPGREAVRSVMEMPNPSEGQVFQVGELFKAVRDGSAQRYFQIYDGLEEALRREPHVVALNFHFARSLGEQARMNQAVQALVAAFPGDARFSLSLSEFYISRGLFEEAITELDRLEEALGMKDGVSEAFKATAAMALGDFERAQAFARSATEVEAGLELAWWTLLRANTAAQNFTEATEALAQLEDRFGHLLIPQKLRRDRFLKTLIDQQEYKDWRQQRDQS